MSNVIYYFTGTGNSLAVAKNIAAKLEETELVPVASFSSTTGDITLEAERVGIVFPVYFVGLPAMVASFAAHLRFRNEQYIFAVGTFGGTGVIPALRQLDGILRQNSSHGLDAGFKVKMPGNYILMYESPKGEKCTKIIASANEEIGKIAEAALQCRRSKLPGSFFGGILHILFYHRFLKRVHGEDKKFIVLEKCTSCGTCVAVCPANNIELVQNKPIFQHRCELCCSCIHTCPVQAIQVGTKTEKRRRYRNPDVTVAELKLREMS